ncbi:Uma2 family endonuclease [Spirulina sp. CCNP1310]|uniref:Uma2 family endonuclease n=1 Tax=Spirulina sp. CCNP1310 TaxID=3110249 RepID=UPI002B20E77B|nr:Uma2 family endonuclease [Spirulina sp. CCNP1310]MEA5418424.1 Uma2 family endonuclease [Spirulina sp. CCNP1310]
MPSSRFSLTIPPTVTLQVTASQFADLAQANRDLHLERNANGALIMTPPTGGETGRRNLKIGYYLVKWLMEEGGSGVAFDSSTGFILPNGAHRSPDVAWLAPDRWDRLTAAQRQGFIPLCPDFVIELRSASDRLPTLQAKLQEYLNNGTQLGWLIDPQHQQVEIYRRGQGVEVQITPQTLSGEVVLPGFTLPLGEIWR